ncbi:MULTISPECIES: response regulator [Hyphobacterium]|uniref:histidine kinase n=1 Tax=Hyphobacterium vulgare TaxID=1736751 RepID=A0ABV6ZZL1_9PROT
MTRIVRDLARSAPVIRPETRGEVVYDMFVEDKDLPACAVVEGATPIGLISREQFFLKMADRHGRALFARRPITSVMEQQPLIVEERTPVADLNRTILNNRRSALLQGFIVVHDGEYRGIGIALDLFQAMMAESEERSRRMTALAEQLGRARIEALSNAKQTSDFLATMSHEIRTPLNGILGIAQIMMDFDLPEREAKMVRTIKDSGDILLRLLNDVLDISKMDAGKMSLEPEAFHPRRLADEAEALWRPRADAKQLTLAIQCRQEDDRELYGDRIRIEQVLFNLIGNAIKFTDAGSVTVDLHTMDLGGGKRVLRADVSDTGCGVPEHARGKLFETYSQADASVTRKHGGTGLGLAISKRILDMMGGMISYRPNAEGGSRFSFELTLPLVVQSRPEALSAVSGSKVPSREIRVLVAEDNDINQQVISGLLDRRGYRVDLVANGEEAVEAAQAAAYDVILMDVRMPVMDGLAATRAIRDLPSTAAMTPIIALTANATREDQAACLAAGMDDFVSKPISRDLLCAAIGRVTGQDGCSAKPAASAAA